MANQHGTPSKQSIEKVYNAFLQLGTKAAVAKAFGMDEKTVRRWIKLHLDGAPSKEQALDKPDEVDLLKDRIRVLEAAAKAAKRDVLDEHYVKEKLIGLTSGNPKPPKWLTKHEDVDGWSAVPSLFLSDLHWGEVVDPSQIGGVNEYNLDIAKERMKTLLKTTKHLLSIAGGNYPGIVLVCGGDLFSGDIHEELMATNEHEVMPTFMDLYGVLIWFIEDIANTYGRVFIPWVTGNHGRATHKIRNKGRAYTNYDWLIGCLLAKHFENDDRIVFHIPNGPDALYSIYGTRYLLTHGDQFRGGDGMIGALGPITRGDHKKRSRNNQVNKGYDVLLLGHWHQLIQMQRLIVNGSLKGYDEYANQNNFGYEQARQALWLTHKDHGIIMSMPVNVDKSHTLVENSNWVSWKS